MNPSPLHRRPLAPLVVLLACALAASTLVADEASARPRAGLMLGGGLGLAESNFNLEASNDDPDVGKVIDLKIGHAWPGGFALTLGVSDLLFEYQSVLLGATLKIELSFLMGDVSAWYFFDRGGDWEFFVRGGLGNTLSELRLGALTVEEESSGLVLGGGALWYFNPDVALSLEAVARFYGITFNTEDFEQTEEVRALGLSVGILWR